MHVRQVETHMHLPCILEGHKSCPNIGSVKDLIFGCLDRITPVLTRSRFQFIVRTEVIICQDTIDGLAAETAKWLFVHIIDLFRAVFATVVTGQSGGGLSLPCHE